MSSGFQPTPNMSLKPEAIHFRSLALQMQNQSDQALTLLAFKNNSVSADPKGFLADWTPGNFSPCSWHGVICFPPGQVVHALNFTNAGLIGHLHINNLTVLENLRYLYFSGNSFSGDLFLNNSSHSCTLETLDLSKNNLSDPISETFFTACKHLVSVNLSHNSIPGVSFNFGPSLVQLDLSNNNILDFSMFRYFSPSCQAVNLESKFYGKHDNFSGCRNLSVPGGATITIIPSYIPMSLKFLDVSHNNLSGNFSMLEFGSCASLQVLNLSNNALSGTGIPQSLTNCQLLKNLDLSHNKLQGKIPIELGHLRNLTHLTLANNNFSGDIPPELSSICGNLQELDLFGNNLSGGMPDSFTSCKCLQSLNLGQNQLSSNFLNTISSLANLKILQLSFNNITGTIPMSLRNCTQLQVLDLSSNNFTGYIPSGLCSSSSLQELLLTGNSLFGSIPSDLGNCINLIVINLSLNNLSGSIPLEVWMLPKLSDLIMWGNNFSGEIPKGICLNGGNLQRLILNNNQFSGAFPESLTNCTNLTWLSLCDNQLHGEIPANIQNLQKLSILQLSNNSLTGAIPQELGNCSSLIWLNLRSNQFTGKIPTELANPRYQILRVRYTGEKKAAEENKCGKHGRIAVKLLYFKGIRPENLVRFLDPDTCLWVNFISVSVVQTPKPQGSLVYLDLSSNFLSGSIPHSLVFMHSLSYLNLGYNNLTGTIPDMFRNLTGLGVVYLSHNHLDGQIPLSLASLPRLNDIDLSNNSLSGPIPQTKEFWSLPASRFENNSGLCGHQLQACVASEDPSEEEELEGELEGWFWFVVAMGFISGVVYGISFAEIWPGRIEHLLGDVIILMQSRGTTLLKKCS
ncbi:hypothetical protein SLE2022_316440 [Rubroshorea leprosula]